MDTAEAIRFLKGLLDPPTLQPDQQANLRAAVECLDDAVARLGSLETIQNERDAELNSAIIASGHDALSKDDRRILNLLAGVDFANRDEIQHALRLSLQDVELGLDRLWKDLNYIHQLPVFGADVSASYKITIEGRKHLKLLQIAGEMREID